MRLTPCASHCLCSCAQLYRCAYPVQAAALTYTARWASQWPYICTHNVTMHVVCTYTFALPAVFSTCSQCTGSHGPILALIMMSTYARQLCVIKTKSTRSRQVAPHEATRQLGAWRAMA